MELTCLYLLVKINLTWVFICRIRLQMKAILISKLNIWRSFLCTDHSNYDWVLKNIQIQLLCHLFLISRIFITPQSLSHAIFFSVSLICVYRCGNFLFCYWYLQFFVFLDDLITISYIIDFLFSIFLIPTALLKYCFPTAYQFSFAAVDVDSQFFRFIVLMKALVTSDNRFINYDNGTDMFVLTGQE